MGQRLGNGIPLFWGVEYDWPYLNPFYISENFLASCANTEGEDLGDLVTSCRQRVDTQGAVPDHNNSHFTSTSPLALQPTNCLVNTLGLQPCNRPYKKGFRDPSPGTTPHMSTICLPDVGAHGQISQSFPLCICILQVIKYWKWEWPGNKVIQITN